MRSSFARTLFATALLLVAAPLFAATSAPPVETPAPTAEADAQATPEAPPLDLDGLFGAQSMATCQATCNEGTVSCTTSSGPCTGQNGVGVDCGGSCQISCSDYDASVACRDACQDQWNSCLAVCGSRADPCFIQCRDEYIACTFGCPSSPSSCTN